MMESTWTQSPQNNRTLSPHNNEALVLEECNIILNAISDWITLIDIKTRKVIQSNQSGTKWFHLTTDDIIGHSCCQILFQHAKTKHTCPLETMLKTGKAAYQDLFDPESQRWYGIAVFPVLSDKEKLYRAVHIVTEITEIKKAEKALHESQRQYKELYRLMRLMCDNVPDMIWAKDLNKNYLFTNQAMCKNLLNANHSDEPVGKNDLYFAMRQRSKQPDNPNWHTFGEICQDSDSVVMQSKKSERFDEYGNVKGEFLFLDVYKAPFWDEAGEMIGTVGCGRDVTRERQIRDEREQLISELKKKNEELERFTYTVSHDLKSPLITIKGFLGLLDRDLAEKDVDAYRKDKEHIVRAVDKMEVLLKEILELSRVGRVMSPEEKVPLREIVDDALFLAASQLHAHQVAVDIDALPEVCVDRNRIREVYSNLIDNALKFKHPEKKLCIHIGYQHADDVALFFFKDNGIGVDEKFHQRIFGLFNKLNPDTNGSGAGLAIAKRIIEVHGGDLWVESEGEGLGSTFYFTLKQRDEIQ